MYKSEKDVLSWIVKKNEENIDYLKGTIEQASKYIEELQKSDGDNEYRAVGYCHEFNEQIKYKDLEMSAALDSNGINCTYDVEEIEECF